MTTESRWVRKLSLRFSEPLVWILDRLPSRRILKGEVALHAQFCRLMADEDINRIVREKPVDYLGFSEWLKYKPQTEKVQ